MRASTVAVIAMVLSVALASSMASATEGGMSDGGYRVDEALALSEFVDAGTSCSDGAEEPRATRRALENDPLGGYAEIGPYGRPIYAGEARPLEGRLEVVPGGRVASGAGKLFTFRIVAERDLEVDGRCFGLAVEDVLWDTRSWGGAGRVMFERVDGPVYDFTIILASPDTTDRLCRPLRTGGVLSCRRQTDVIINSWRWANGAKAFGDDVAGYRSYLVNHEVAAAVGLDVTSPHIEELYPNVRNLLASMEAIRKMDVSGAEPDMAFIPPRA